MHEKFRESSKAANYVTAGLLHDFPDATAEVIQVSKSRSRVRKCKVSEIGPILEQMCRPFPNASVHYHPDNSYGFVAEIHCHGERGKSTKFGSRHSHTRPRVIVLLREIKGKDVMIGGRDAPKNFQDGPPILKEV